jgi:hypothetical protein
MRDPSRGAVLPLRDGRRLLSVSFLEAARHGTLTGMNPTERRCSTRPPSSRPYVRSLSDGRP